MRTLFLLVNNVCDIKCSYCFYTTKYQSRMRERIKPEQAAFLSERLVSLNFGTVILTGGDPLHSRLKRETYQIIAALKNNGLKVIINSSGVKLDESDYNTLAELAVDRIDISIDSHLPEVHNAQRGRHSEVVQTIQALLTRGLNVATTTVVTAENVGTIEETLAWLKGLGVSDIRFQEAFLPSAEYRPEIQNLPGYEKSHTQNFVQLSRSPEVATGNKLGCNCQMGKSYFVSDPDGSVKACFHRNDLVIGNLFSDEVDKLEASLSDNALTAIKTPPCIGKHCVSLFDNPKFWERTHAKATNGPP